MNFVKVSEKQKNFKEKLFVNFEDVYEITQFLRGELYVVLDYCLSKTQHFTESSVIKKFLENYLEFFLCYLEQFLVNLPEVIENFSRKC